VFKLKKDKIAAPEDFLGAQLSFKHNCWNISSMKCVQEALKNVEQQRKDKGLPPLKKQSSVFPYKYRPELDMSDELCPKEANYYQELLGILRWAIELGRIDICYEVSSLASHLALPRRGHLNAAYHIFGYLKHRYKVYLGMHAETPQVSNTLFEEVDWQEFYPDAKEELPPNMPEPRGKPVVVQCFVDANHASNRLTRRSQTGIILFCNQAPVIWYSKRQNTVESSTFGSEFVAARIAVDMIEALRYKLRMFGIPVDGPANVYCDNQSVVTNASVPTSKLSKKHNSIAYHRCREAAAAQMVRFAKVDTTENISDMLTKSLAAPVRDHLMERFMYF
jgi:hypothetical protein